MFCRFCGKTILEDSEFCPYCGKELDKNETEKPEKKERYQIANASSPTFDDDYYRKEASKIASDTLIKITKVLSYVAFAVFLFFNIKMAPSYGATKVICYIVAAGIGIALIVLLNKKVVPGASKKLHVAFLIFSILIIIASIGLRIVYESKVDYVSKQIPTNGDIVVTLKTETDYYNSTGTGYIRNPSTNIRIGDKWYEDGDKIAVTLGKDYSLRVGSGGSGTGGYVDGRIVFNQSSFSNGQFQINKNVRIAGVATSAKVKMTFEKYSTFWEVVLYKKR